MTGVVHPFTKALYEPDGNGNIRVIHRNRVGIFGTDGHWIAGELRECDPHMCGWVGGPRFSSQRIAADRS